MRAVALASADGGLVLSELPDPACGADELLVRVHAASINPIDVRVATGRYPWGRYEYPVVPGFDFAGTVQTTGAQAAGFVLGDEVLGYWSANRFHRGTWAEYVTVPASGLVVRKPESLPFDIAAAMPLAAMTAVLCVDAVGPLEAGDAVVIVGAGGAIGSYAVQLAAATGASVLATGKRGQERRLHELGAAQVIDYTRDDVVDVVRKMRRNGVAALIDLVDEDRRELARLSQLVRSGGRIASACFGADVDALALRRIAAVNVVATHAEPELLARLVRLVEQGSVRVHYDERRGLEEVPAVVVELSDGPSRKTVIDVA